MIDVTLNLKNRMLINTPLLLFVSPNGKLN